MTCILSSSSELKVDKNIGAVSRLAVSHLKGIVAALLLSTPLMTGSANAAEPVASPSCNSVMVKTREFRDAPKEQIEGICKSNRNSAAYWSCMNVRIDKGQKFADAGIRCNKLTASR